MDLDAGAPHESWALASGLRLRALSWAGEGAAPGVLMLHATSFCADVWGPVWEAARATGVARCGAVAVDVRGHGRSAAPAEAEAYAWSRLADDAIALAESFGGGAPLAIAGHSSGATAALVAAARRPELVRGVFAVEPVLWDPPPAGPDADSFPGSRALAARARKRRSTFPNRHEARKFLEGRFPYAGFASATLEAFLAGGLERGAAGAALRCRPEVEAALYDGAAELDLAPLWRGLAPPVRVAVAEHSAIVPGALARLVAGTPALELDRVPGATHFAALEDPVRVGRSLASFLGALQGGEAMRP
jgi:pimeloyl-ACP methyl ester carboxylesterase